MEHVLAGTTRRVVTRGAEWFVLRDGLIAEIRSYYRQEPEDAELEGFPYASRDIPSTGPSAATATPRG